MAAQLSRQTLSDQVEERLLDRIISRDLKPEEPLPSENKLADDFGVSRPVVREALRSLSGRGVVEILNGKGAVVKPIDDEVFDLVFRRAVQIEKNVVDLMEVREPLEIQSAKLAAERWDGEELSKMQETVTAMREQLHDLETYASLDVKLHVQIARSTHNEMMYLIARSIRKSLKSASLKGLRRQNTEDQLERIQHLHEDILTAIEQRDSEEAERAMTAHFRTAVKALIGEASKDEKG